MAERSYPTSEVRGGSREEQPHVQEAVAAQARRAERSYSMFKVRRGDLVQGKESSCALLEQPRYPTSKVRKTQVRR